MLKNVHKRNEVATVELVRIGNKLINRNRIDRCIDEILRLRVQGKSQQEAADAVGVDRSFVSRIEALGEVRKGGRIAVVGFPIENKAELERAALAEGVDFVLLFTDRERYGFASDLSGVELVNEIMQLTAKLKSYDAVIFLGSDMRIEMVEAMIGRDKVIGIELGKSPIQGDVRVDVDRVIEIVRGVRAG